MVLTFNFVDKHQGATIQIHATEQYFHLVLFIMVYKVNLTFKSAIEALASLPQFKWKLLDITLIWFRLFIFILQRENKNFFSI